MHADGRANIYAVQRIKSAAIKFMINNAAILPAHILTIQTAKASQKVHVAPFIVMSGAVYRGGAGRRPGSGHKVFMT